MTAPRITLAMLRGACQAQRALFKAEWPGGAEATLENVMRASELGLELDWGERWFTPSARAEYRAKRAPLWAEYNAKTTALRAEYNAKTTALRAEYEATRAPLWAEYEAQRKTLWAECEAQSETLWAEYRAKGKTLWAEYQTDLAPLWLAAFLASHGGGK